MTLAAALMAALAGWIWSGEPARRLAPPRRVRERPVMSRIWVSGIGAGVLAAVVIGVDLGLAVAALVTTSANVLAAGRRRREAAAAEERLVSSCQALVALLRAGAIPARALRVVAERDPVFAEAAAAGDVGGSVAAVLSAAASRPGCGALAQLAAAWRVAELSGASLTVALHAVSDQLLSDADTRRTVAAEVAAARATGRLLALLPLAGIALGFLLGGDPLGFLVGTAAGRTCLVAGTLLACVGTVWTDRIIAAAAGPS